MSIIKPSDFTGFFAISSDTYTDKKLRVFISQFEGSILCKLLGFDLAQEIIAYLPDRDPADPLLDAIIDPFCETYEHNDCIYESKGLINLLVAFIYYEFITQNPFKNTPAGNTKSQYSSTKETPNQNLYRLAEQRRNEALDTWEAIQWKINQSLTDYPDFKGVEEKPVFQNVL